MRNIFKFCLIIVALSLVFSSCSNIGAAAVDQGSETAVISVSGSGEVYVIPDIGYINVGVRSQGETVTDAITVNNDLAKSIKAALVGQDIDEKDIQTSNFNVNQQSDYDYQGNPTSTFYVVENTVYITVRNLENIGEVLDAVAKGGANTIYGVNFDIQDDSKALSAARILAVQSAQTQAQDLAAAAGVELGDLISIHVPLASLAPLYGYGIGGGGAAASSVPIASGQINVSTQVQMTFAIK